MRTGGVASAAADVGVTADTSSGEGLPSGGKLGQLKVELASLAGNPTVPGVQWLSSRTDDELRRFLAAAKRIEGTSAISLLLDTARGLHCPPRSPHTPKHDRPSPRPPRTPGPLRRGGGINTARIRCSRAGTTVTRTTIRSRGTGRAVRPESRVAARPSSCAASALSISAGCEIWGCFMQRCGTTSISSRSAWRSGRSARSS